jgi:hypothetical protein
MMSGIMSFDSRSAKLLQFFGNIQAIGHLYLMGGFAEDALLDGRITQDRGDVDFLVPEERWISVHDELHGIGIGNFEALIKGPDGGPLAFVSNDLGFTVEVWPAKLIDDDSALVLPGTAGFFRLRLPPDTFEFSGATLEEVKVQTVSPRTLALLRATSASTRGDAEARAADRSVFQRIVKQLLAGVEDDLIPEMTGLRST